MNNYNFLIFVYLNYDPLCFCYLRCYQCTIIYILTSLMNFGNMWNAFIKIVQHLGRCNRKYIWYEELVFGCPKNRKKNPLNRTRKKSNQMVWVVSRTKISVWIWVYAKTGMSFYQFLCIKFIFHWVFFLLKFFKLNLKHINDIFVS